MCKICSANSLSERAYCHYCGYLFDEEYPTNQKELYALYCRTDNVSEEKKQVQFFKTKPKRIRNILSKRNILFDQISSEREKVKNIKALLNNISKDTNKNKIQSIIDKMESLIDELLKCRINMEILKYSQGLCEIREAITKESLKAAEVDGLLREESTKYVEWIEKLKNSINSGNITEYVENRGETISSLKEEIALKVIAGILSSTNLAGATQSIEVESDNVDSIESEIQRINYEIDRLTAEISLR